MNTNDKNINNTTSDRRTYLLPCVQIIKMETTNPSTESLEISIDTPGATDANGRQWQGDDLDSWDKAGGCNGKNWGSVR